MAEHRAGYVALIGRPNGGKSTLLNKILGGKLAITSSKPQTTRHQIAGIHSEEDMQCVFVDTPGIHDAFKALNKKMVDFAQKSMKGVDAILWVCDVSDVGRRIEREHDPFDKIDLDMLASMKKSGAKVFFVANKLDLVAPEVAQQTLIAAAELEGIEHIVPISALNGEGVDTLLRLIREALPEHPPFYPPDQWTVLSERFLVEEIIREKVFHLTEAEIPYSTAVDVIKFDESKREESEFVKVFADIIVERSSQKGIVIGKRGAMLKRIGTLARKDVEELLGCKVHLQLFVKVEKDWSKSDKGLLAVGFREPTS